ncbi:caspase-1-like [Anopheles arabiensis]|uniref:caspase-1-like n=1 Tax=Anopheles arabiensis TaxID=7173 RepID=UPI001AAD2B30|nr:caspase-1-like [Anopheles arabiensis]XP_040164470.1 caspase-1-like [Anopheles arabiensis]
MGCAGSKHQEPKKEKKKSTTEIVTDARATSTSALLVTKETKVTHQVHRTITSSSNNARTSQTIATAANTTTTTNLPTRTYTQVYEWPTLTRSVDASRPFSYLQPAANFQANSTSSASRNTTQPVKSRTYDLSKNAYVLVFHHDQFENPTNNREGSANDLKQIKEFCQHYRCDRLDINENKTKAEVKRKMGEISRKDFTKNSCLIVFIMSHGSANDTIMAKDGQFYSFQDDVVEYCTSNRTLNDKPKLFVLQACRGDATMVADATPSMSYKGDIIIFQSSYQGAVSFRNTQSGSFFMQAFLRLAHEHNGESIVKINPLLNQEFTNRKIQQTPTLMTTLRKDFILRHLLK